MSDLASLEKEVHRVGGEVHTLNLTVAVSAERQDVMQRDIASISKLLYAQTQKEIQFEDTVRQSFVRIELKLARWTGIFVGGYAIAALVWAVYTFISK